MRGGPARILLVSAVVLAVAAVASWFAIRRPAPVPPKAAASGEVHPPMWTDAEKRAVDDAVAAAAAGTPKLKLRPAVDADATDTDEHRDLDAVYGEYHPYMTRGDLDGDGRLDFVQAFVETGRTGAWFHVAVFFARPGGGFEKPVWVERSISLADGDVTVERSLVIITPDLGSEAARRWRWEPADKAFVDPDAEPRPAGKTDDDAPEETPEQKPRARI